MIYMTPQSEVKLAFNPSKLVVEVLFGHGLLTLIRPLPFTP